MARLNQIGCVLFNHKRDIVIAKVIKAWQEGGRGCAKIQFDEDQESDTIYKKVKSGTLKGVSVGYTVDSWEEVAAGKNPQTDASQARAKLRKGGLHSKYQSYRFRQTLPWESGEKWKVAPVNA